MPIPLALGLLALGGLGQTVFTGMQERAATRQREQYGDFVRGAREGLDLSTDAGMQQYTARLMEDPRTAQLAGNMLDNSMDRAQQQRQYMYGMENMSAAQQANMQMQQQQLQAQQQHWGAQLAQQQAEAGNLQQYRNAQLAMQQKAYNDQLAGLQQPQNPWTAQQLQEQTDKTNAAVLADPAIKGYVETAPLYQQTSALLSDPNQSPYTTQAQMKSFLQVLEPRSIVTDAEGRTFVESSGAFGGVKNELNALFKGEGFDEKSRAKVQNTIDTIMRAKEQAAKASWERMGAMYAENPATQRPAINREIMQQRLGGFDLVPVGADPNVPTNPMMNRGGGLPAGPGGVVPIGVLPYLNPGAAAGGAQSRGNDRDAMWNRQVLGNR